MPLAHALQLRLLVEVPARVTKLPAGQSVHGAHAAAFSSVLKVPLRHPVHVLSAVAVPGVCTCCPAAHTRHRTHAVALRPSSSHVPLTQASFAAAPPAQYVPASHASHCPGDACTVPGWHSPGPMHLAWLTVVEVLPAAHR